MAGDGEWEMLLGWLREDATPAAFRSSIGHSQGKTLVVDGLPTALRLLQQLPHVASSKNYPMLWATAVVDLFKRQGASPKVVALILIRRTLLLSPAVEEAVLVKYVEVIANALKKECAVELRVRAVDAFAAWLGAGGAVKFAKGKMGEVPAKVSRCFTALGHLLTDDEHALDRTDVLHLFYSTREMLLAAPMACRQVSSKIEAMAAQQLLSSDVDLRNAATAVLCRIPACYGGQAAVAWENLLVILMNMMKETGHVAMKLGLGFDNVQNKVELIDSISEGFPWLKFREILKASISELEGGSQWTLMCAVGGVARGLHSVLSAGDIQGRPAFVRLPLAQLITLCDELLQALLKLPHPCLASIEATKEIVKLLGVLSQVGGKRCLMHARKIEKLIEFTVEALKKEEGGKNAIRAVFYQTCKVWSKSLGPWFSVTGGKTAVELAVSELHRLSEAAPARSRKRKRIDTVLPHKRKANQSPIKSIGQSTRTTLQEETVVSALDFVNAVIITAGTILPVPMRVRIETALFRSLQSTEKSRFLHGKCLQTLSFAVAVPVKGEMVSGRICQAMETFRRGKWREGKEEEICSAGEVMCTALMHPPRPSLTAAKAVERLGRQGDAVEEVEDVPMEDNLAKERTSDNEVEPGKEAVKSAEINKDKEEEREIVAQGSTAVKPGEAEKEMNLEAAQDVSGVNENEEKERMEKEKHMVSVAQETPGSQNKAALIANKVQSVVELPVEASHEATHDERKEVEESDSDDSIPSIVT